MKTIPTTMRLPAELKERLQRVAAATGADQAEILAAALDAKLHEIEHNGEFVVRYQLSYPLDKLIAQAPPPSAPGAPAGTPPAKAETRASEQPKASRKRA